MHDLKGIQRDLLFVVAGMNSPSGQDVKKELQDSQGRTILPGRLYANLDALVEMGLVEKSKYDGRTNQYTVTRRGRQEIQARYEWQTEYMEPEQELAI